MVQRIQNMLDKTDLRPRGDDLDMFQHVQRIEPKSRPFDARGKRKRGTWNSYAMGKGERVQAVRGFFGGGVSSEMQGSHQEQSGISFCHSRGGKN